MAVRRTRSGTNGTLIGLVVFVFLFVIALGLAILFYQQRANQQQAFEENQAELNRFVTRSERSEPAIIEVAERAREENRSVVQQLLTEVQSLKRTLVGSADVSRDRINTQLEELGIAEGRNVVSVLDNLYGELTRMENQLANYESQIQARTEALDELAQRYQGLEEADTDKMAQLAADIERLRTDYTAFTQQSSGEREQLAERLEQAREEAQQQVRQRDERIAQLQDQLATRENRINELQLMLGRETPEAPDQTEQPDGRIIDVNNSENLVYLNLGSNDHLILGMTFEVFDPARGVQADEDGELRGKATIEVVDISETSAAARIVRSSFSRPVLANDLIANLVYDQDREYKFYVFGEFDLDGDGRYTASDRETVVELIRRWGGEVVDPDQRQTMLSEAFGSDAAQENILPFDTDFLIIGNEPTPPQGGDQQERDPVQIRQSNQARERWERYNELVEEARALSIPVINQNRFLALIGHYER